MPTSPYRLTSRPIRAVPSIQLTLHDGQQTTLHPIYMAGRMRMRAHRQSGLLLLLLLLEHVGIRGQLPEPRVGPLQQDFRGGSVGGVRGQAQRNDVGHPRAVALIGGGGGG